MRLRHAICDFAFIFGVKRDLDSFPSETPARRRRVQKRSVEDKILW